MLKLAPKKIYKFNVRANGQERFVEGTDNESINHAMMVALEDIFGAKVKSIQQQPAMFQMFTFLVTLEGIENRQAMFLVPA